MIPPPHLLPGNNALNNSLAVSTQECSARISRETRRTTLNKTLSGIQSVYSKAIKVLPENPKTELTYAQEDDNTRTFGLKKKSIIVRFSVSLSVD